MKKCFLLLLVFFLFGSLNAAPKHSKNTKYPSYKGLVMAGYQAVSYTHLTLPTKA